jgi:hypothetical protein
VTFDGVYDYGGTSAASANTFQYQFDENTGIVHIVYQTMSGLGNAVLVGYSPGGASMDPGSRDISATLAGSFNVTGSASEGRGLALAASARPVIGAVLNLDTAEIPAGTLIGATLLGFGQFNPGIDLSFLGMPGCFQYVTIQKPLLFFVSGSTGSVPLGIPNNAGLVGMHVFAQSVTFSAGFNAMNMLSSNGVDLGLGNL